MANVVESATLKHPDDGTPALEDCTDKFNKVLAALLNRNFTINNDVYLEMIVSHLGEHRNLLKSAEMFVFLDDALGQWESETLPSGDVAAFTLQVLAMIVGDEWSFARVQSKKLLDRFQDCVGRFQHPSVKLGHVLVLKAVSRHAMGLAWIKSSGSWRICLDYYNGQLQTIFITKEASLFIYEVLERFGMVGDYELVKEIVRNILSPLLDVVWKSPDQEHAVLVDDEKSQRIVTSMLNLMCTLFRKLLVSNKRSRAAYHILITFKFERNLWCYADAIQDHSVLTKVWETHILANCTRLGCMDIPAEDTVVEDLKFEKYTINFLNYVNFSLRRGNIPNVMLMAQMHHHAWNLMADRAPEEVVLKNQNIKFGDQILLLQLFPVVYEIKSLTSKDPPDYIEKFCMRLYDISCEFTVRLMYACRDVFEAYNTVVAEMAIKSIQGIVSMNTLPRPRAIIAFQAFVYVLKEFLPDMCYLENQCDFSKTDLILSKPNLLAAIINALHSLIQNYKFNWKECIESTTLVNFMLNLLGNPNLPPRHVVLALKLTQLSIEHFLAPNLALLMDNIEGSGLSFVGRIIYQRLHDSNWEVRDSALELLASIVEISEIKFPSFQKHVLDCDIIPVVEAAAKNDSEPYVRASALRCLTLMVKIRLLWEHSLVKLNLMNHLITVFDNESEGVVRREAVNTIREIYSNHKIQAQCLDAVFSVLAFSAANDLYWEVKLNALVFWKVVMCRQFQHQGMIDGTFPAVTFSKEHKKIITLTNKEILLRLRKVLNELSLRGCLGVLLACLGDDCDLEVVRQTVEIIRRLMCYLNKYNYMEECVNRRVEPASDDRSAFVAVIDTNYSEHKRPSDHQLKSAQRNDADYSSGNVPCLINSDEIIDSIVNLDDVNLLSITYKHNMSVSSSGPEPTATTMTPAGGGCHCEASKHHDDLFRKYAEVSPEDFLKQVAATDFDELIAGRESWLRKTESFGSLLDDVLFSYYAAEVNEADCY
uniref:BRCA1-associated ATM activator 1 n=1 Tax=Culex pipiens TaxID=7175 RepID=A0A8D8E4B2_CULPI